ncbi:MAG: MBOAT family O-acyltransferase [Pedobacter sp.]
MFASKKKTTKQIWFWLSIIINLGFLGIFKYYNFFASSFSGMLANFGYKADPHLLNVILPVGISFYTFHGISYVVDIYKCRIEAEKNLIDYSLFVSFFPLLVAGPIERATHLLPQIKTKRTFSYEKAVDGLRQILWGLFKKVVIADQCAVFVNTIFNGGEYSGSTLALGAFLFALQIYGDFSGYSDIALGVAKLFGIELLRNFSFPYFSRDIAEFWRRWHISLSTWFRDYLYIPLGGSKGGMLVKIRNTFIIFIVSGFWHGANWTFLMWGFLNALFIMPSIIFKTNRRNLDTVAHGKLFPNFREFRSMVFTFLLSTFAWIFFRAPNIGTAFEYISGIFNPSLFSIPSILPSKLLILIFLFFVVEWIGREDKFAIEKSLHRWQWPFRYAFYYGLIYCVFYFAGKEQQFIYFQF